MSGERTVAALDDIGNGLKTVGESFVALTGETLSQRSAIKALDTKIDTLQATADEIKTDLLEIKSR